jgi:hypothetical protein
MGDGTVLYQRNPPHQYSNLTKLKEDFPFHEGLTQPNPDISTKLFGNPMDEDFEERFITHVSLPGIGRNRATPTTIKVHRYLADILVGVFEQIASMGLNYVIYGFGEAATYCFRYGASRQNYELFQTDRSYPPLDGKPWNIEYAKYDRQHKRFNIPVGSDTKPRWKHLSNHSWGSAIDINPTTNPMKSDAPFDIPREIVEVMYHAGYRWGGYYESVERDYMHFEFAKEAVSQDAFEVVPSVGCFPFGQPGVRESPLKYLAGNEQGKGGFYPLSNSQGLHGGIHLQPELLDTAEASDSAGDADSPTKGLVPVRACLPGYIVAARLFPRESLADKPALRDFVDGQDLGFVLVRHVLDEVAESAKGKKGRQGRKSQAAADEPKPQSSILYSLYMHLVPPDWQAGYTALADTWLGQFLRMEFGGVVSLDPQKPAELGRTFWAKQVVAKNATTVPVLEHEDLVTKAPDGRILGFAKPTPEAVHKAIEALRHGSVITFDRPALSVAAGDTLGFVEQSGAYLHWEIFAPETTGDAVSGIDRLVALASGLHLQPTQEVGQDNFLTMPAKGYTPGDKNEVEPMFEKSDKDLLACLKDGAEYWGLVRDVFNGGKGFAPKGGRSDDEADEPFTYPLTLSFKNPYHYNPEPGDAAAKLVEVTFKGASKILAEKELTIDSFDGAVKLVLNVPAQTRSIELWSRDFHLILQPPAERNDKGMLVVPESRKAKLAARHALLKEIAPRRWRELVLCHINEWHADNLALQLKARQEAGFALLPGERRTDSKAELDEATKLYRDLTWWGRTATGDDPNGEVPMLGDGARVATLFGDGAGQLAANAKIKDMNPVIALWLVDILAEEGRLQIRKTWPLENLLTEKPADNPALFAVVPPAKEDPAEKTLRMGSEVTLAVIQPGYGSSRNLDEPGVVFTASVAGQKPRIVAQARYVEGAAVVGIHFPCWKSTTFGVKSRDPSSGELKDLSPQDTKADPLAADEPDLAKSFVLARALGSKPEDERWEGLVMANQRCPFVLDGFLGFDCWTAPKDKDVDISAAPTDGGLLLPVSLERVKGEETTAFGLRIRGEFIVGPAAPPPDKKPKKGKKAKNAPSPWSVKVSEDFTLQAFMTTVRGDRVFDRELEKFKLAIPLLRRLQNLRDLCRPAKKGQPDHALEVTWLKETGLSLDVGSAFGAAHPIDQASLLEIAARLPASSVFTTEPAPNGTGVRLTYTPSTTGGGTLSFTAALGPVLERLSQSLLKSDTDQLVVRPRLLVPMFGHAAFSYADDTESPAVDFDGVVQSDANGLRQAVGSACMDVEADRVLPPQHRFGFGPIHISMSRNAILTEVELTGARARWGHAEVKIAGTVDGVTRQLGHRKGNVVVEEWFILPDGDKKPKKGEDRLRWGKKFEFEVSATHVKGMTEIPWPVKASFDSTPQLLSLDITPEPGKVLFQGTCSGIPTNVDMRIACQIMDSDGNWVDVGEVERNLRYDRPSSKAGASGRPEPDGKFGARLTTLDNIDGARLYRFVWQVLGVDKHVAQMQPDGATTIEELSVSIHSLAQEKSGAELGASTTPVTASPESEN